MCAHDRREHRTFCQIAPPNLLLRIAEEGSPEQRDAALRTLAASAAVRAQRSTLSEALKSLKVGVAEVGFLAPQPYAELTVYDAENGGDFDLPGVRKRGKGDPPDPDVAVNEARGSVLALRAGPALDSSAPGEPVTDAKGQARPRVHGVTGRGGRMHLGPGLRSSRPADPVSSLGLRGLDTSQPPRRPG
jgi:hypothetical protein